MCSSVRKLPPQDAENFHGFMEHLTDSWKKTQGGKLTESSYFCLNKLQEAGAVLWVDTFFLPLC